MSKIHFNIPDYQHALLQWYAEFGRHSLPWQETFDAYHVWISEVMLQQTQVNTVIPYYQRFITVFPDVSTLAQASQDQVLTLWAGLGYYSRARNLHKTAQLINSNHQGTLPKHYESLIQLPGIGPSTANAILSICYNKATPILDGNVKRIFSRIFAINQPINQTSTDKALWAISYQLMPENQTQCYTQAIMDLGSLICTRTKPQCERCPMTAFCLAYQTNTANQYPIKLPKKAKPIKTTTFYLHRYQNQIALKKNHNNGIWGGLYVLPEETAHYEIIRPLFPQQKHTFTHYHLYYEVKLIEFLQINPPMLEDDDLIWIPLSKLAHYPLPKPIQDIFNKL